MHAGHVCTIQRVRSLIQKKKKTQEILSLTWLQQAGMDKAKRLPQRCNDME